jgi:Flp pilus assembly protein TadB
LTTVEKKEEKLESRTSAAVAVAKENADTPAIVRAELSIAQAGLPVPTPEDLAFAKARAAKADPKQYEANAANAAKAKADIDAMWSKMEAEQRANAQVMSEMAKHIEALKQQLEQAKRDGQRNLYTLVAAGMMVIGGVAFAFGRLMIAAGFLVSGFCIGAVPFLLDSAWFLPSVGGVFLLGLLIGGWHLYSGHLKKDHAPQEEDKNQGG